jgi:predicted enzyme related to lactoylglutathione lyase
MVNVVIDCDDALVVGQFWSAALSRPLDAEPGPSHYFTSIGLGDTSQTSWLFAQVPEAKSAKNRVHIDFATDDPVAMIARLVDLGAKRGDDKDEWGHSWTVMQDPEGNEFCVSRMT